MEPPEEVWTIGHSTHTGTQFVALLRAHKIEALADVRQFPGSRRHPQFNQEQISNTLAKAGIEYVHFPELGGRRKAMANSPNQAWRNASFRGYADYMMTSGFLNGINRLLKLASQKQTAIMCAELLWWRCHRALISDFLKARGIVVSHILSETKVDEHPFTSVARVENSALSYRAKESTAEFKFS